MSATLNEIRNKLQGPTIKPRLGSPSPQELELLEQARDIKTEDNRTRKSALKAELATAPEGDLKVAKAAEAQHAAQLAVANLSSGVAAFEPVAPSNELMPKAPQASRAFEAPSPKPPETPPVPTPPVAA